ncbi:hypothetical protein SAMN04487898_101127 [Pedobacter sp. ok626]|uniref:DUF4397 domain-containing protein n=1 Tax=Pedobacter sp. ok626 TaxID=1761882 RepID=UPI0008904562|nr:DUF4397 domain-containing protein [Pedobacter sp. ok626]SDJ03287.1 hypothetical protein SAMN04487898_101127 [Pedobacter sp. ok626]
MRNFKINTLLLSMLLSIAFLSCKKEEPLPATSSLTIANAVAGSKPLVVNLNEGANPSYYLYRTASALKYGVLEGDVGKLNVENPTQRLRLFQLPDTTATSQPLFDLKLQIVKGSINSLLLTGTANHPDYLLDTTIPPYHNQADSTFGLRFTNLSYQSKPVNVYMISNGERKEVEGLIYKGITGYKNYAAMDKTGTYTFEFRDQETQRILAVYTLEGAAKATENLWRYRNFTLALIGIPDTVDPEQKQKTFMINNY